MNNKKIIKPSAETLVVGARVKLRNGKTTEVTEVLCGHSYPIKCANNYSYTDSGEYLLSNGEQGIDIVEAIPKVDVSTFKAGDTIKFKSGKLAKVLAIHAIDGAFRVSFKPEGGVADFWVYHIDGGWRGAVESALTIITHFPKDQEAPETSNDPVAHPSHYTSHPSGIECIQVTQHMNFNLGNVVKYVWRNGLKDSDNNIQDLKKAQWYLSNEIERLEKQ